MKWIVAAALAGLATLPAAYAEQAKSSEHIVLAPGEVQWKPAPPKLPAGAEVAVLEGDPAKQGFFTMRLKLPDGYRIPPHTHPAIERVTVLSGNFNLGQGEQFDQQKTRSLPAGSYFSVGTKTVHYAWTQGETVVQISTLGPWDIKYVNPEDDPSRKRK